MTLNLLKNFFKILFNKYEDPYTLDKLCFIDFETTGLEPVDGHRVIEYALLKMESAKSDGIFECAIKSSLINPEGKKSDAAAARVHGISERKLKNAKKFHEEIDGIIEFVGNRILIAHNSDFEMKFIINEFNIAKRECNFKIVDSIKLIKKDFPNLQSYSLASLCNIFKVDVCIKHRAEDDVIALFKLYQKCKLVNKARY